MRSRIDFARNGARAISMAALGVGIFGACSGEDPTGTDDWASTEQALACAPQYTVKAYAGGDRVTNHGVVYECKPYPYSGWCGIAGAYEPGVGFAWTDAWVKIGPCGTSATGGAAGTGGTTSTGGTASGGSTGGSASGGSAGGTNTGGTTSIAHPGLISTSAELDRVRSVVNAAASHPMKEGWSKLRSTRFASLSYKATPYAVVHVVGSGSNAEESAMRNDAVAAYAHALQWSVTRDARHSQKAIEIIRAWATILTDVVPVSGSPSVQDELEVAWYAPIWLAAAELIRHHAGGAAGWSATDRGRFDDMVALFKRKADAWGGSQGCCPNQALSVVLSRMSIGVYTGNRSYFQSAVDYFKGSVLPRSISSSGEVVEINRIDGGDCGHATYNVEAIFDIAEIAWHQGVNLYSDARLPKGLEYLAQCITTGVQTSSEGFVHCSTMRPTSVEIANNHYRNRVASPALPNTQTLLGTLRPSDQGTGKFVPWDTLTHAELD